MGEYAKRKSDEQMVKIGTWPNMYYLRHDQKNKVEYDILNKGKRVYYRLIFKDEIANQPGNFDQYDRSIRIQDSKKFFTEEQIEEMKPGVVQINDNNKNIMLLLPCYHGLKENDDIGNVVIQKKPSEPFALQMILEKEDGKLTFEIMCLQCRTSFILDEEEIQMLKSFFGEQSEKDLQLNINYVLDYNKKLEEKNE